MLLWALHQRYGLVWYEADLQDQSGLSLSDAAKDSGQRSTKGTWRRFYERTLESDRVILARTRMLPSDSLPFIYVSLDGRDCIRNFHASQQSKPETAVSLSSLILGHHLYADWSSHFQIWKTRTHQECGHFLKIEDLISDPLQTLNQVEKFLPDSISTAGPAPQAEPFITERNNVLRNCASFSDTDNALYVALHGACAENRGYSIPSTPGVQHVDFLDVQQFVAQHKSSIELLGTINQMTAYIDSLQNQLSEETERLRDYIDVLKEENSRLKQSNTKATH